MHSAIKFRRSADLTQVRSIMQYSSRFLPLVVAVSILWVGLPASAFGQSVSGAGSVSSAYVDEGQGDNVESKSVVLKNTMIDRQGTTARLRDLDGYANARSLDVITRPVHAARFNLNGVSAPLPQSEMSTQRKVLYIVGGVLVVGGAVAGILALSGDDGVAQIPAPPGRPQ